MLGTWICFPFFQHLKYPHSAVRFDDCTGSDRLFIASCSGNSGAIRRACYSVLMACSRTASLACRRARAGAASATSSILGTRP